MLVTYSEKALSQDQKHTPSKRSAFSLSLSRNGPVRLKVSQKVRHSRTDRPKQTPAHEWSCSGDRKAPEQRFLPSSLSPACQTVEQGRWSPLCRRGYWYLQNLLQVILLRKKSTLFLMDVTTNSRDTEVTQCRSGTFRLNSQIQLHILFLPLCDVVQVTYWVLTSSPVRWGKDKKSLSHGVTGRLDTMLTNC